MVEAGTGETGEQAADGEDEVIMMPVPGISMEGLVKRTQRQQQHGGSRVRRDSAAVGAGLHRVSRERPWPD
jgi:hypothetical protein